MKVLLPVILCSAVSYGQQPIQEIADHINRGATVNVAGDLTEEDVIALAQRGAKNFSVDCRGKDVKPCLVAAKEGAEVILNSNQYEAFIDAQWPDATPGSIRVSCLPGDFFICRKLAQAGTRIMADVRFDYYDLLQVAAAATDSRNVTVNCNGFHYYDCRKFANLRLNVIADKFYTEMELIRLIRYHENHERVIVRCAGFDAEQCRNFAIKEGSVIVDAGLNLEQVRKIHSGLTWDANLTIIANNFDFQGLRSFAPFNVRMTWGADDIWP